MKSVTDTSLNISSIPAINNLGNSSSGLSKILWITILMVGLFQSGLRINRFLNSYFQYPVVISLDIEEGKNIVFPGVTFCNLNRMKEEYQHCKVHGKSMQFCKQNRPVLPITEREVYAQGEKDCSSVRNEPLQNVSEMNEFLKRFSSETDEGRRSLGYQSHELIRDCSFDGTVCSSDNFSQLQSLRFGNCYTFNKTGARKSLKMLDSSATSGLQVVLAIDPNQYLKISHTLGAKVVIHNPEDNPDLDQEGVTIRPGFETSIALKQTVYERLPSPYRDLCVSYRTGERPGQKSQLECLNICEQKANYATCGCVDPTLLKIDDLPLCNISNRNESCCQDDVLKKMAKEMENEPVCHCPFACSMVFYKDQMSMSVWPSEKLIFSKKTMFSGSVFGKISGTNPVKIVRNGYARVRIFYSTLKRSTYKQNAKFHQSELFSYLGGELGLWLGLSVVALFEMLELLLKFCKCLVLKMVAKIKMLFC